MKHIKNYKVFEAMGDKLIDDFHLDLLEDLSLDITDLGADVEIIGQESVKRGYNLYDIFIKKFDKFSIYDIDKENLSNLKDINKSLIELNKLNDECLNLINRAIDNGLYLCEYEISTRFKEVHINIRFMIRQDGGPFDKDFKYYNEDDLD